MLLMMMLIKRSTQIREGLSHIDLLISLSPWDQWTLLVVSKTPTVVFEMLSLQKETLSGRAKQIHTCVDAIHLANQKPWCANGTPYRLGAIFGSDRTCMLLCVYHYLVQSNAAATGNEIL